MFIRKPRLERRRTMPAGARCVVLLLVFSQAAGLGLADTTAQEQRSPSFDTSLTAYSSALATMAVGFQGRFESDDQRIPLAQERLRGALHELDGLLATFGPELESDWKRYLRWEQLEAELDVPREEALEEHLVRFYQNYPGLEKLEFRSVRTSVEELQNAVHFTQLNELHADYRGRLANLARLLERYEAGIHEADAYTIGQTLAWLESADQAHLLVHAVRERHCQANGCLTVDKSALDFAFPISIDEVIAVDQTIQGTSVRGEARAAGNLWGELADDPKLIRLSLQFRGNITADTVAERGRVSLETTAETSIEATKELFAGLSGVGDEAAVATGSSSVQVTGINTRSRLLRRLADRYFERRRGQFEADVTQQAEQQIAETIDEQVGEQFQSLNDWYRNNIRLPALRVGAAVAYAHTSTTNDQIKLDLLRANRRQLGASSPPPPCAKDHAIEFAIHETLLNNLAEKLIVSATIRSDQLAWLMQTATGNTPRELRPHLPSWNVQLSDSRPVCISLSDGSVRVLIRSEQLTRGEQVEDLPAAIRVEYVPVVSRFGLHFERVSDVTVTVLEGRGKDSAWEDGFTFLQRKFDACFQEELHFDALAPPAGGVWEKLSQISLGELTIQKGWVSVGVDVPTSSAEVTEVAARLEE
jgi:hypothetical protein